jgi:DNA-binding IclR family transcriptional regulator
MKLNQSVQRATAILRAAADRADGETASGLARASGLSTSTALRLIHTLEREGFLARRSDGRYTIGLALARLGRGAEAGDLIDAATRAALDRLAAETRETVTLSVVRGGEALDVVLQIDTPHMVKAVSWVGRRYPLHASSSGKVLLAALDSARFDRFLLGRLEQPRELRREIERVRAQGYADIVDELEEGLASVSVPITERGERLSAILNVTGPTFRFDAERRTAALTPMRAAASQIEGRWRSRIPRDSA